MLFLLYYMVKISINKYFLKTQLPRFVSCEVYETVFTSTKQFAQSLPRDVANALCWQHLEADKLLGNSHSHRTNPGTILVSSLVQPSEASTWVGPNSEGVSEGTHWQNSHVFSLNAGAMEQLHSGKVVLEATLDLSQAAQKRSSILWAAAKAPRCLRVHFPLARALPNNRATAGSS